MANKFHSHATPDLNHAANLDCSISGLTVSNHVLRLQLVLPRTNNYFLARAARVSRTPHALFWKRAPHKNAAQKPLGDWELRRSDRVELSLLIWNCSPEKLFHLSTYLRGLTHRNLCQFGEAPPKSATAHSSFLIKRKQWFAELFAMGGCQHLRSYNMIRL